MALLKGTDDNWNSLRNGDRQAILALYREHYVGLMNFGVKLSGNRELTKDCFTQVLLRLWDNRQNLPEVSNTRSYLITCIKNEILKELQSEKSLQKRHSQVAIYQNPEPSYEEHIIAMQTDELLRSRLHNVMQRLTDREKELLRMRFFENKSYDEIAMECGITKRTVYNIVFSALKTLKAELTGRRSGITALPLLVIIALTLLGQ